MDTRPREGLGQPLRCAVCHDTHDALIACAACGTWFHEDCRTLVGRCPTLGCQRTATPKTVPSALLKWKTIWIVALVGGWVTTALLAGRLGRFCDEWRILPWPPRDFAIWLGSAMQSPMGVLLLLSWALASIGRLFSRPKVSGAELTILRGPRIVVLLAFLALNLSVAIHFAYLFVQVT